MLPNESWLPIGLLSYKVKSLVMNQIMSVISGAWNLIIGRLARIYQEPLEDSADLVCVRIVSHLREAERLLRFLYDSDGLKQPGWVRKDMKRRRCFDSRIVEKAKTGARN